MLQSFLGPVDDSWLLAMQAGMLVAVERIATWRVDALFDSVVAPLAAHLTSDAQQYAVPDEYDDKAFRTTATTTTTTTTTTMTTTTTTSSTSSSATALIPGFAQLQRPFVGTMIALYAELARRLARADGVASFSSDDAQLLVVHRAS